METAINKIEEKQYGKDIMVVETGYSYAWALGGTEYDYTKTYPYTEEGQRQFTADLITMLNKHTSVKGLFWWWPEDNGNKNVTAGWWNAALYNHNTGQPYSAFYELKNFINSTSIESVFQKPQLNDAWYSLDGRQLPDQPTNNGIYIHNGKKIIF